MTIPKNLEKCAYSISRMAVHRREKILAFLEAITELKELPDKKKNEAINELFEVLKALKKISEEDFQEEKDAWIDVLSRITKKYLEENNAP